MRAALKELMTRRAGIVAVLAGVAVVVFVPKLSTTRQDLVDNGMTLDMLPREVACWAFIDGGYDEFLAIVAVDRVANPDGGGRDTIWPRPAALQLREFVADEDANCRVTRALTWAQVADINAPPTKRAGSCGCWAPSLGACTETLPDGGTRSPTHFNTMAPGTFAGPGCRATVCGELFGHRSRPPECPE